jgi:hypothetical protein
MPPTSAILDGLTAIANQWRPLAIVWHAAAAAVAAAFVAGWRPTNRTAGHLIAVPVLSVAILAGASGNPFNAATFLFLGSILLMLARRLSVEPVRIGSPLVAISGAVLVAFGWCYPHFLESDRWTEYLYAAPTGLIPCPTLSAAIGVTLILNLLGSRTWSAVLALAGLVYGVIGVFRLGVEIDSVLLAGAVVVHGIVARQRTWRFGRIAVRAH